MPRNTPPQTLDITGFARSQGTLAGECPLTELPRLSAQLADARASLTWKIQGHMLEQPWLQMQLQGDVPLVCQRCLEPVVFPLDLTQNFRFVADEETAELEDERSEEDVLALTPSFDVQELLEDEILLALPLIARHDECPVTLPNAVADPEAQSLPIEDKQRPFEGLAQLLTKKSK